MNDIMVNRNHVYLFDYTHSSPLLFIPSPFVQSFFAERFFQLFDQDNSGYISLKELMDGLTLLTNGTEVDKLRFLFQVYDVDGI